MSSKRESDISLANRTLFVLRIIEFGRQSALVSEELLTSLGMDFIRWSRLSSEVHDFGRHCLPTERQYCVRNSAEMQFIKKCVDINYRTVINEQLNK